jgi:hypothetical protein
MRLGEESPPAAVGGTHPPEGVGFRETDRIVHASPLGVDGLPGGHLRSTMNQW